MVIKGRKWANLLARDVATKMGLVIRVDKIHHDLCKDIGLTKMMPLKIHLRDNAVPHSMYITRRGSFPLMGAVKGELDRMVQNKIIQPIAEPTDWYAPMVPVIKKNCKIRICVDLK